MHFGFVIAVGFAEEFYFRGLILKILQQKGIKLSIILSSVLFSIGHLSNLLNGASFWNTILQLIFAFLFGLVAAEITILTKSIMIGVIWHIAHNFIALITQSGDTTKDLIILGVQCVILLIYNFYLIKKISNINNK